MIALGKADVRVPGRADRAGFSPMPSVLGAVLTAR